MGMRGPQPRHSDQDYLDAIIRFEDRFGFPPTYRDVADELGVTQSGYHSKRIRRLRDLGVIASTPGRMRSITVRRTHV